MDETRLRVARGLWTLYEPVHAVSYFASQAISAFERVGLRGFWRGYFAGRAAPLGAVGPAPITALFGNFSPSMVERALPSVWDIAVPDAVLDARAAGAAAAIASCLPATAELDRVVSTLEQLVRQLPVAGRTLAAANAALVSRTDPVERLWQAATTLREWRGDAHLAALVCHGVAGLDILALRCRLDMSRASLQRVRGWSDDEWVAAEGRLISRGLLAGEQVTAAGHELIDAIERATDAESALGTADEMRDLARLLNPIAISCASVVPFPNPIGLVAAWDPDRDPDAEFVVRA